MLLTQKVFKIDQKLNQFLFNMVLSVQQEPCCWLVVNIGYFYYKYFRWDSKTELRL